jgi:hypothetical protein
MFDGRIYRAAFLPLLLALVIAGFSLTGRPGGLSATLAPDAFNGARAFAELRALLAGYPDRRPGSAGDERLALRVAETMRAAGGAGGGFAVSTYRVRSQTIDGRRTLTTVLARRPGSTGESPILIVAHRDAALPGSAAELSGTAALLELARVFARSQTRRTIVLASTSGGSGGDGGAAQLAAVAPRPLDGAIVLGDLAGVQAHPPFTVPFSAGAGFAPRQLTQTLGAAIAQEVGVSTGEAGLGVQLAHLSFPLAIGEQGPLEAGGIPAVLVQASGERGPAAGEAISQARLQSFGRAALSAVYALDESPDVAPTAETGLGLGRKLLPGWAVRMLGLALLLPPLIAGVDALARLRRRRQALGRSIAWAASCAWPALACSAFAMLLGALGLVAAPAAQPSAAGLGSIGSRGAMLAASAFVLGLASLTWPALVRRLGLERKPAGEAGGVGLELVLLGVCVLVWVRNPYACLLLIPAAHACVLACSSPARNRAAALVAALVGIAPVVLLGGVYARELGLGPLGLGESVVLALAGGQVGALGALLWSLALGCIAGLALLGWDGGSADGAQEPFEPARIVTRGPLSYAGPGSLGGTESALRR